MKTSIPLFLRRVFVHQRGFSIPALLLLTLAIGSNTAVFTVLNDVFFRPLSGVEDPDGLVALLKAYPDGGTSGFSHPNFQEYRDRIRSLSDLVATRSEDVWLQTGEEPRRLAVEFVTSGYFSLLGVRIVRGRDFLPEETSTPDTHAVAILSHALWKGQFDSDPGVIGSEVRLNRVPFTIVGVAPESYRGLQVDEAPDLWIPLMMESVAAPRFTGLNNGLWRVFRVIGRLRPNVTAAAAQAELNTLASEIEGGQGDPGQGTRVVVRPDVRRPDPGFTSFALLSLAPFFAVLLVLVAACANLAGLLIARHFPRRREFAVQMALGAGRRALVAGVVRETLFLTCLGSASGLVLAPWIMRWIQIRAGLNLDLSFDHRVGAFTVLVAVLAGLGVGLVPALLAARRDLVRDLRDHSFGARPSRAHGALVSAQIAISLILLTGASLFARSFRALTRQDVGFETDHLLVAERDLSEVGYPQAEAAEFFRAVDQRLRGLPGVLAAARSNEPPLDRGWFSDARTIVLDEEPEAEGYHVQRTAVTPEYFEALGLNLLAGRPFTTEDDSTSAPVAIVNEPLARRLWPNSDPVGRTFRTAFILLRSDPVTVVGVAPGIRPSSREGQALPAFFVPLAQDPQLKQWLLLRVAGAPRDLIPLVRGEIQGLDPDLPPPIVETLAQRRVRLSSDDRFYADLTGAFALLGVVFSALGLFGILSLEVSRRIREIGVRMAVGAGRGQIAGRVLVRGLWFALPGIGIGLVGGLGLTRLIEGLLFGVVSWDPLSFALASALLLALTLAVSVVPAFRAANLEPGDLLRAE